MASSQVVNNPIAVKSGFVASLEVEPDPISEHIVDMAGLIPCAFALVRAGGILSP